MLHTIILCLLFQTLVFSFLVYRNIFFVCLVIYSCFSLLVFLYLVVFLLIFLFVVIMLLYFRPYLLVSLHLFRILYKTVLSLLFYSSLFYMQIILIVYFYSNRCFLISLKLHIKFY